MTPHSQFTNTIYEDEKGTEEDDEESMWGVNESNYDSILPQRRMKQKQNKIKI